jgi:hypothetical protein
MYNWLQLVNQVLRRLREDEVTDVNATSYSKLIGTFINDAKREVENAWYWKSLNSTVRISVPATNETFFSLSSGSSYVVGSSYGNSRSKILYDSSMRPMVYCTTPSKEYQLCEMYNLDMDSYQHLNPDALEMTDQNYFALSPSVATDEMRIRFRDYHLESRSYAVGMYTPQADFEDQTTVLLAPWRPVVHLALIYALDERGEEIGEPGSKAWLRYETSLADEVALDARYNSYRIHFTVP